MHAVYPGTFDPFTAGHFDVADRARRLFSRLTILAAVNDAKDPAASGPERAAAIRALLPPGWATVTVAAWSGLTTDYCHSHGAGVIVRGVRHRADLTAEYALAAMNESLGVPTLLLPARPELAAVSSTAVRAVAG